MRRLAWLFTLLSCGARTDLGGAHGEAGPSATCSPPPAAPATCTAWHAGTPQTLGKGALAGATSSGCGVLVGWYVSSGDAIAWSTRWVDFDGSMLAATLAHPSLAAHTSASAGMSMVEGGMLEDDETGCRFVLVDVSGQEQGAVKSVGATRCGSLARVGSQWSFLRVAETGGASLVVFDDTQTVETPLVFSQQEYVWDRAVLADGSILVTAFWEDANTAQYTNWLTPFDAHGAALGPSVAVAGHDTAPVLVARAGNAAMAAWSWTSVNALAVNTLGQPTNLVQAVTTASPIYELSMFTQPNGDVLFVWVLLDEKTNDMSLHARVMSAEGFPLGDETLLLDGVDSTQVHGAIEAGGARALLTVTTNDGTIEALPLTCQ